MVVTCRTIADQLVKVGMVTRQRADEALARIAEYAPDHDKELGPDDVLDTLDEFGVALFVHGDDVVDLLEGYREVLERAAELSGTVTVSDVELVEEDGDDLLKFRVNGEPTSWPVDHEDDYLDQFAFVQYIDDLEPDGRIDPRCFYRIPGDAPADSDTYILATLDQARALRDTLGLNLEFRPSEDAAE